MKRLIIAIVAICASFSTASAQSDFFLDRIDTNEPEIGRVSRITIGTYSFASSETTAKYRDSMLLISTTKSEALRRYRNGTIDGYQFADIARELEDLSFSLNEYFRNMRAYERTHRIDYKKLAETNLIDSRAAYTRLKDFTRHLD